MDARAAVVRCYLQVGLPVRVHPNGGEELQIGPPQRYTLCFVSLQSSGDSAADSGSCGWETIVQRRLAIFGTALASSYRGQPSSKQPRWDSVV